MTKKNSYISSRNPTVIWNAVLVILELEIPRPNFKTWLKSTRAINISDNTLTVSTPSPFAAEMINKRLMGSIRKSIKKLTGEKFNIKITIEGSENLKDVQTSPKYVKNQKILQIILLKRYKLFYLFLLIIILLRKILKIMNICLLQRGKLGLIFKKLIVWFLAICYTINALNFLMQQI